MIKRRKNRFRARRSLGSVILTTATFLAFLGIVWQAYQSSVDDRSQKDVLPIIQAQTTPEKMRPADEGGMRFANQNVSIFEQIEEPFAGDRRRIERLSFFKETQEGEQPPKMAEMSEVSENFRVIPFARDTEEAGAEDTTPLPVIAVPSKTDKDVALIETASGDEELEEATAQSVTVQATASTGSTTTTKSDVTVKEQQKENLATTLQEIVNGQVEKAKKEGTQDISPETTEQVAMAQPVAKEVKKQGTQETPQAVQTIYLSNSARQVEETTKDAETAYATGDYTIQLGSVRSREGAQQEWKKIQSKLPALLTNLSLHVEEADLGDRGMFYRIQVGQLIKADADRICGEIKASKAADCLVRKR